MNELEKWLKSDIVDEKTKAELIVVKDNEDEIKSRFLSVMDFGTAGQRGIMAAGLNRMNIYTIRYTTQALANLIKNEGKNAMQKGVVICYDCRNNSKLFAETAACVLAANGIIVYIFNELRPTPLLSYTIREIGAVSGINITASHNPKEYNGYKVYWSDGAQLPPSHAKTVLNEMNRIDIFKDVFTMPFEKALDKKQIIYIGKDYDEKFLAVILSKRINKNVFINSNFSVIYTPFHGAGYRLVPDVLKRSGIVNLECVSEQMIIDGNFPTLHSPNPEEPKGFEYAIKLAESKNKNADILIATDPDADRIGICAKDENNNYLPLTGNQIGIILLNYIITSLKEKNELPKNAAAIKTIVTSEIAKKICEKNGVKICDVFTGFKFIGEKMEEWRENNSQSFIFAFEESFGYLIGDYCRDKDAVGAAMLLCEAAAFYKLKGQTLFNELDNIYNEYGYHLEITENIAMKGLDGLEKTKILMAGLRENIVKSLGGIEVKAFRDYQSQIIKELKSGKTSATELEKSNVIYYELADDSRIVVRPSGTEPKVKVYYLIVGRNKAECQKKYETLKQSFEKLFE